MIFDKKMFMNRIFLFFITAFVTQFAISQTVNLPLYKKPSAPIEKRVEDLIKRMTLTEKLEQMTQRIIGQKQ